MIKELVIFKHPEANRYVIKFNGVELPMVANITICSPFNDYPKVRVDFVVDEVGESIVRIEEYTPKEE